jgi:outer membrane protein OmpA-like peptidoglycan-associated protein
MKLPKILFPILSLFCIAFNASAQQSSKTKAVNKLYEKGSEVKILNTAKINTANLEFSPAYYQNGIVFVNSRKQHGKKETYYKLFYADLDGSGLPLEPREFSVHLNTTQYEGPVTFDRDGKVLYFTNNNIKNGVQNENTESVDHLKIYEAKKGVQDWGEINELSFNSNDYDCAHPTLSADGQKLYFTSNMPGGYGGMDLYFVEKTGNGWSRPINLGSDINTKKNELFPFIHSSGNLFFSSNGYKGAGELDLFMIDISGRKWGQVTNLGQPFNSPADDLGIILNPDGTRGYFASSRKGGTGKDDIYMFEAAEGIWGRTTPSLLSATLKIYDSNSKNAIEGAEIRVFEKTADGFISSENDLFEGVLLPAEDGSNELVFKMIRKDTGALNKADLQSDKGGEAVYDFLGERQYLLLVTKDEYKSSEMVHSTLGNESPSVISIPLEKSFCSNLSGVVINKADNRFIPNAVIRVKSSCESKDQVFLTDENGAFNICLPVGCDYTVTGIKENFLNSSVSINNLNSTKPMSKEITLSPATSTMLSEGSVIVLNNIYYDFDKSFIRKGATHELDDLYTVLSNYPSIRVELSSHTDSRGSDAYNLKLSQKRAESAKEYLVARGIAADRIEAVGYGEKQLRNDCDDNTRCSEAEHQFNRRTEVEILKIDEPVRVQYKDYGPDVIDPKN